MFLPWRYQGKQGWCLHPKPMGCPSCSQPSSYSWDEPGAVGLCTSYCTSGVLLLLKAAKERCCSVLDLSRNRCSCFAFAGGWEKPNKTTTCRSTGFPLAQHRPSLGKGTHACVPREHDSNNPDTFQRALLGIMTALNKHYTSVSQGESSGLWVTSTPFGQLGFMQCLCWAHSPIPRAFCEQGWTGLASTKIHVKISLLEQDWAHVFALVPKRNITGPGRGEERCAGGLGPLLQREKRFLGPE